MTSGPGRVVLGEPGDQTGRGRPDHGEVHPVGPGPHRPAQPGGAEGQRTGEPVGQLGRAVGQARR